VAFNRAFAEAGLPWRWDDTRYGRLLEVAGGLERLLHDLALRDDAPRDPVARGKLARRLQGSKNEHYSELVRGGGVALRGGVTALLRECRQHGRRMAIATTSSRRNVEALLDTQLGAQWHDLFEALVCGEDVKAKKPDPEAYRRVVDALDVSPGESLVVEDSPDGAAAARRAGLPVIVTRSHYFRDAPIDGPLAIGPGLDRRQGWHPAPAGVAAPRDRIGLADLDAWYASGRRR